LHEDLAISAQTSEQPRSGKLKVLGVNPGRSNCPNLRHSDQEILGPTGF